MRNDNMQPFLLLGVAMTFGIAASIYVTTANRPHSLTFEQRWAPVEFIDGGVKGDRLDRVPTARPYSGFTMPLPKERIHEVTRSAACDWRVCVIT